MRLLRSTRARAFSAHSERPRHCRCDTRRKAAERRPEAAAARIAEAVPVRVWRRRSNRARHRQTDPKKVHMRGRVVQRSWIVRPYGRRNGGTRGVADSGPLTTSLTTGFHKGLRRRDRWPWRQRADHGSRSPQPGRVSHNPRPERTRRRRRWPDQEPRSARRALRRSGISVDASFEAGRSAVHLPLPQERESCSSVIASWFCGSWSLKSMIWSSYA